MALSLDRCTFNQDAKFMDHDNVKYIRVQINNFYDQCGYKAVVNLELIVTFEQ